jgi:hypothetical protein
MVECHSDFLGSGWLPLFVSYGLKRGIHIAETMSLPSFTRGLGRGSRTLGVRTKMPLLRAFLSPEGGWILRNMDVRDDGLDTQSAPGGSPGLGEQTTNFTWSAHPVSSRLRTRTVRPHPQCSEPVTSDRPQTPPWAYDRRIGMEKEARRLLK